MRRALAIALVITATSASADTSVPSPAAAARPAAAPAATAPTAPAAPAPSGATAAKPDGPDCGEAALDATAAKVLTNPKQLYILADTLDKLSTQATSDSCRVRLFDRFWDHYVEVQQKLADRIAALDSDAARAPLLRLAKMFQWAYHESEAGAFLSDDGDWLPQNAGTHLPPAYRDYLALRLRDGREGFAEDAALLITWSELRERLRRWEDLDRRYPSFDATEDVHARIALFLGTLLTGTDNTRAFVDGKLDRELRAQLSAYLADPQARNRAVVRGYWQILQRHHFRESDDLAAYLARQHVDQMPGHEPPRM